MGGTRPFGYTVEGQNLTLESRSAEGQYERFGDIAAELVRLKVDVTVTLAHPAAQAAKGSDRLGGAADAVVPAPRGGIAADSAGPLAD
jgi:hypothetical protein